MNFVVIGILGTALVLMLVRRIRKAKEERKPMELVAMLSLAFALVCIILRRFGA